VGLFLFPGHHTGKKKDDIHREEMAGAQFLLLAFNVTNKTF